MDKSQPQFPVYIPSKGRPSTTLTTKTLDFMKVPYKIIVEEQEYKAYCQNIDKKNILVLDKSYQENYNYMDEYDDLGKAKGKGAGPVRNFAWDHSIAEGHKWHWVMDDNIRWFYRLNNNKKLRVSNGGALRAMEDFTLRYSNVVISGPHYMFFKPAKAKHPPFVRNRRIYSCLLIKNDIPFRWEGRYNEDTLLSIAVLKKGYATILFNAFLQGKVATMTMKGGCNEEFYQKESRIVNSTFLTKIHPDIARLAWRFGRPHHYVDYDRFKNNSLGKRTDLNIESGNNEYGMKLKKINDKS